MHSRDVGRPVPWCGNWRDPPPSFETWLENYIGANSASTGQIAVIDLSLVPSEVIHIGVSVLARLIFESLQRYRRTYPTGESLPRCSSLRRCIHSFVGALITMMQPPPQPSFAARHLRGSRGRAVNSVWV